MKTIHEFVIHLNSEFSIEVILAFIEFTQYLHFILKKYPMIISLSWNNYRPLIFCDNMPYSTIIKQRENNVNGIFLIGLGLYQKYIKLGARYELMLSYRLREQLIDIFENRHSMMSISELDESGIGEVSEL